MRQLLAALCLIVCLLSPSGVLAADSWLMPGHDAAASENNPGARFPPSTVARLRVAWTVAGASHAIATDRRVYAIVGNPAGPFDIVVLDAATGHRLRSFSAGSLRLPSGSRPDALAYGHGKLVIATSRAVVALKPLSGRVAWRTAIGAGTLAISHGIVYSGMSCLSACTAPQSAALELRSGRVLWRHSGAANEGLVLISGDLYQSDVASKTTRIFDPPTGVLLASLDLSAHWIGDSSHAFAQVTAPLPRPSWIGEIGPTGNTRWRTDIGHVGVNAAPPGYAFHTLYTASNRFHPGLVAVNAANGAVRWAQDLGPGLAFAVSGNRLFVTHSDGELDILDAITGHSLRRLTLPASVTGGLIVAANTVYVETHIGLIALRG